jgi:phage/plasmid-like protein (TIGR03299 family)
MINTYIGREAAWHKLGTVTGKYQTTEELLADPGFQYRVFKSQLHDGRGKLVNAWGTFRYDLKDELARNHDGIVFLGAVGENYTVMQHGEGFATIDSLMNSTDGAHYETAGVLGAGERVWALADLGHAIRIGDDVQKGYLLFATGHDGTMAHQYRIAFERVVCANTLAIALGEKTKASLSIRHTKNASGRLADARTALEAMGNDVARMEDRLNFLAGKKMTRESLTSIMDRLFPKKQNEDGATQDTTRRSNIVTDVLKIYELNDGNAFPEQRGTAYNLLNAITNYADHERSSKDDGRAESALFGSGDTLKSRALELVTVAAGQLEDKASARTFIAPTAAEEIKWLDDLHNL